MQIAQNWRLKGQRYALKGNKCEVCGEVNFPPREVCPHCQNHSAKIYTFEQPQAVSDSRPSLQRAAR